MVLHPDIHFAMLVSPRIPVVDAALAVAVSAVDYTAAAAAGGFVDSTMMTSEHSVPFGCSEYGSSKMKNCSFCPLISLSISQTHTHTRTNPNYFISSLLKRTIKLCRVFVLLLQRYDLIV